MPWIIDDGYGQPITEGVQRPGLAYEIAADRGEDVFVTELTYPSREAVSPVYRVTPRGGTYRRTRNDTWRWVPYIGA